MSAAADQNHATNHDSGVQPHDGYDPVAFFIDAKPVHGSARLTSSYNGAIYWFASAKHKAAFDAQPAKYEPQLGAFCAYAVSQGRTTPIDVDTWRLSKGGWWFSTTRVRSSCGTRIRRGS